MTEYDLQKDSGVLYRLEDAVHYTYTVFPGSSIKANTQMQFY